MSVAHVKVGVARISVGGLIMPSDIIHRLGFVVERKPERVKAFLVYQRHLPVLLLLLQIGSAPFFSLKQRV